MKRGLCLALLVGAIVSPAWSQSITTDGNIETDGQLVSNVATGTAPLAVSSTTMVPSLNADQLDGMEAAAFAQESDLQTVERALVAMLAQFPELGKVPLTRTGQTNCYDAAGAVVTCGTGIGLAQDGDLQLGVTWPNPRFTDNGDGTVTDNLTGLVWLDDANCFSIKNWTDARAAANGLFDGCSGCGGTNNDCGLQDGSIAGRWRLPNVRELQSLATYGLTFPAVTDTSGTGQWSEGDPFSGVQSSSYWSSTSIAINASPTAWQVDFDSGSVRTTLKSINFYVWPVRGGQ